MEHDPFLAEDDSSSHSRHVSPVLGSSDDARPFVFTQHYRFLGYVLALKFCIQFTSGLIELPLVRLVEHAACRDYLGNATDDGGETACKVPIIQDKLATVLGYKWAFDSLPCKFSK